MRKNQFLSFITSIGIIISTYNKPIYYFLFLLFKYYNHTILYVRILYFQMDIQV